MNRYGGLAAILAFVAIAPGVGANAAAQTSRPLAVSCSANSFKIVFDASGQVRILQYYVHWTEAKATGKVLAYMDQSTKQTNGSCRSAKPRRFRPSGFIGPYPRGSDYNVFCAEYLLYRKSPGARPKYGKRVVIQIQPVLRRGTQIGNRMYVWADSVPMASAFTTTRSGGVSWNFGRCTREQAGQGP